MFKVLIYLVFSLVSVNALLHESSYYANKFAAFEKEYGKKYADEAEFNKRLEIFSTNVDKIEKFNSEKHTYKLGINKFSDLTYPEFKSILLTKKYTPAPKAKYPIKLNKTAPSSVDWRKEGVLSPVDNQGECGSCWSFATSEVLQAFNAIKQNKKGVRFSKQQFIDCAWPYRNRGCDGGSANQGLYMAEKYATLCTEEEYPYLGKDYHCALKSAKCTFKNVQKSTIRDGFGELALKSIVAQQPVTAGIMVTDYLQSYKSGIYSGEGCPPLNDTAHLEINHDTVIVGYGTENNVPYWIIRNSWGADWGEGGYFRIVRTEYADSPGMCATAVDNALPLDVDLKDFERDEVVVTKVSTTVIILAVIGVVIGIADIVVFFFICNCCCNCCYKGKQRKSCFC